MNLFTKIMLNPLFDKWARQYYPEPKAENDQTCDGYSCMWCSRCPRGEYWKCPAEDLEEYRKYILDLQDKFDLNPAVLQDRIPEVDEV